MRLNRAANPIQSLQRNNMKNFVQSLRYPMGLALVLCVSFAGPSVSAEDNAKADESAKWTTLFDGESLEGWEKVGRDDSKWEVVDGVIKGTGGVSMLVNTSGPYKNFRYRAEVKINDGGNSGVYFRTTRKPGFMDGYEAQVDSTHTDPIRTGSLYGFCHVYPQLVKPDTWFTYEIEVKDDNWRGRDMTRIKITVDGNELYEYMDFEKTYGPGHFAFQQHDPGSIVHIRKSEVMPLDD
ncbi:3-keto-disaccharide hydrolase [Rhodopirellula baltica]